jgi:hydrogenase maturation protease
LTVRAVGGVDSPHNRKIRSPKSPTSEQNQPFKDASRRFCAPIVKDMKTLIIGLGNPILGDDGVGWKVAEEVSQNLPLTPSLFSSQQGIPLQGEGNSVEVDCLSLGGLSLMERMLGYDRVVLVDSMETGQGPVGSVRTFPLASLLDPMAGHSASAHDTSLITALKTAESLGADIPKQVDVVAVEAENVYDFSEELSPSVAAAVPAAVQTVLDLLQGAPHDLS